MVKNHYFMSHPMSSQLPNAFKDFIMHHLGGKSLSDVLMTHCQRELFHEQWKVLLNADFIEAYKHGVVITCCDGVKRRFYPQIFTYSADYPEKYISRMASWTVLKLFHRILIAFTRNLGKCPCPRCKIPLDEVHKLGADEDMRNRQLLARCDNCNRIDKI
jgi:hypothetical protein